MPHLTDYVLVGVRYSVSEFAAAASEIIISACKKFIAGTSNISSALPKSLFICYIPLFWCVITVLIIILTTKLSKKFIKLAL